VANDYVLLEDSGKHVVEDRRSGLDWYVNDTGEELSWEQAVTLVRKLNMTRPLGLAGWRLPSTEELASVLEPELRARTFNRKTGRTYTAYCIEELLLPAAEPRINTSGRYWSCDPKSENWIWTLEVSLPCGFHKWGRYYGAEVLAVRRHE
jgi:hypothetical protein